MTEFIEANGARIPQLGLGTLTLKEEPCAEIVQAALKLGYRHLDTAEFYGNEREVGEGLHASGLKREEVFICTKVGHPKSEVQDFERSMDQSLEKLKLSVVDLVLIHWPGQAPLKGSIPALVKLQRAGKTRHVGVANFTVAQIEEAVRLAEEALVTNQIEVHPFLDQSKVIAACKRHGISITAYCPIGRGKVPGNATLEKIGKAHGKSAAQVSLRWLVQQGIIVVPRSSKVERLKENMAIFDFELTDAEMAEIGGLKRPDGRVVNPPHAPKWD
jgi:diketogulonate reductase-like aldo/keto reductase